MALHNYARFDTNASYRLLDGTGSPVTVAGTYMEGDFNLSGLQRRLNEVVPATCRGQVISLGHGDPLYPAIGVSERVTNMIATSAPGPVRDFMTATGAYAANVSTMGAGTPYTCNLELTVKGVPFGSADDVLLIQHIHWAYAFALGRPNTNTWTGTVYGSVFLNGVEIAKRIDANGQ